MSDRAPLIDSQTNYGSTSNAPRLNAQLNSGAGATANIQETDPPQIPKAEQQFNTFKQWVAENPNERLLSIIHIWEESQSFPSDMAYQYFALINDGEVINDIERMRWLIPYQKWDNQLLRYSILEIKLIQQDERSQLILFLENLYTRAKLEKFSSDATVDDEIKQQIDIFRDCMKFKFLQTQEDSNRFKKVLIHIMGQVTSGGSKKALTDQVLKFYLLYYSQKSYQTIIIGDKSRRILWDELKQKLKTEILYAHSLSLYPHYLGEVLRIMADYINHYQSIRITRFFTLEFPLRRNIVFLCQLFNTVVQGINYPHRELDTIRDIENSIKWASFYFTYRRLNKPLVKIPLHFIQLIRNIKITRRDSIYQTFPSEFPSEVNEFLKEKTKDEKKYHNKEAMSFFSDVQYSYETHLLAPAVVGNHTFKIPERYLHRAGANENYQKAVKNLRAFMVNGSKNKLTGSDEDWETAKESKRSIVVKATYGDENENVACKIMKPDCYDEFQNEVLYLMRFDSPHVMKLKDFRMIKSQDEAENIDDIHYCIITEYMQNGSLYDFLHTAQGQALAPIPKLELAHGILKGLMYLHENFIHADLKSPNILIDHTGKPKLADFGSVVSKGKIASIRGTTCWMAIEMLKLLEIGETECIFTQAIDIYSFGIILYEIFGGKHPYEDIMRFQRDEQMRLNTTVGNAEDKELILGRNVRQKIFDKDPDEILKQISDQKIKNLILSCWNPPSERANAEQAEELFDELKKASHAALFTN